MNAYSSMSEAAFDLYSASPDPAQLAKNHAPAWMVPKRSASDDAALWESARAAVANVERQSVAGSHTPAGDGGRDSKEREMAWAAARAAVDNVERERAAALERERELEMPVLAPLFRGGASGDTVASSSRALNI
eukprot:CAMPEP_0114155650 /NCGR_PEP_ID=MMETSP0043_2-20121206/25599_1 /TAXON_ID=464988 /ORGANISM="Hemiselmis andersenii, Strain CCMP644" /LENGTH=133 /DNA_ID=CAMNT_0001250961 /DNA_START=187 /DNA_END=589 /DNA_ORIENTATION=-